MAEGTKSATFGVSAVAYGEYSTSLGSESSANGEYDTSVGYGAQFSGGNSTSVGSNANASEMNTISIGSYSSASATDSVALGYGASATEENSVALGTNSTTSTVVSTATGTIAGTTYTYAGGTAYGTVSVGSEDGERTITNVAAGRVTADSTDAINGSQLYATNQAIESVSSDVDTLNTTVTNLSTDVTNLGTEVSNLSTKVNGFDGRINRLDNKVNKAVAGSAALAALHPLDFNPDDKWSFAVGYGNYNSANAMAVGAFYRPSEDTMISIGGAMGNGENIVNAGLSFKLGQSNGVSKSKVTMAREIVELSSDNRMMKDQIAALTDKVNALMGILDTSKKATFPDVPENH